MSFKIEDETKRVDVFNGVEETIEIELPKYSRYVLYTYNSYPTQFKSQLTHSHHMVNSICIPDAVLSSALTFGVIRTLEPHKFDISYGIDPPGMYVVARNGERIVWEDGENVKRAFHSSGSGAMYVSLLRETIYRRLKYLGFDPQILYKDGSRFKIIIIEPDNIEDMYPCNNNTAFLQTALHNPTFYSGLEITENVEIEQSAFFNGCSNIDCIQTGTVARAGRWIYNKMTKTDIQLSNWMIEV